LNRRDFFAKAFGTGVAVGAGGIALLEQELWKPTKSIFLPPKGGWTTADMVASLDDFERRILNPAVQVLADRFDSETSAYFYGRGLTVNIRQSLPYVEEIVESALAATA
jgi:hypothetical protein